MQFNSEANGLDLYTDCRAFCGLETGDGGGTADTTSYPIKGFTRNANLAMDVVNAAILKADGFTFDDTNQTGELLDTSVTFISGATKISVQASWLKSSRVRITDQAGNYITLTDLKRRDLSDSQLNAASGTPFGFFRLGNYIYFDKPTNYAGTAQVQFQRGASYFIYTDTTKTPGCATQFHRLISMMPALDFCDINDLESKASKLRMRIGTLPDVMNNQAGSGMLKELVDFYSQRDTDMKPTLTPQREDYGQLGLSGDLGSNPRGFF